MPTMAEARVAPPGFLVLGILAAAALNCAPRPSASSGESLPDQEPQKRALRLARNLLLVDTHIDLPYRLFEGGEEDISQRTESGDFDYPRAMAGGLDVAFMSIYVPAELQDGGGAKARADDLIDMVEGIERKWPDKFRIVRAPNEAVALPEGALGLALGMENGAPVEGDLENLAYFHGRGVRYITLTHSENNHISDSSYAKQRRWNGLSPFGLQVVAEMNRLGMMIDVSHLSDDAVRQVLDTTTQPVIASHSSAREFTPGFERNLGDELIEAIAENGGVVQINFGSAFLTEDANRASLAGWAAAEEHAEQNGLDPNGAEMDAWSEQYRQDHPVPLADVTDVVEHIEHVVKIAGIDHVGLGSDFDGVGETLPTGLEDVSRYPNLIRALLERGYSEADIAKICGGNLIRVWNAVESSAERFAG